MSNLTKNALTATIVFKASSANYSESTGNLSTLKKFTDVDNKEHTYISHQAIRYNIISQMKETLGQLYVDESNSKSVIQYDPKISIKDSPEVDLFGYMITGKEPRHRNAVVRLSNAISQDPYNGDSDFLTNLSFATRLRQAKQDPSINNSIANSEIQTDYYVYTITIDLDQIGIDTNDNTQLDNEERARRVKKVLRTIKYLYRDIRGRREDLKPLFIIGGTYDIKNPIFQSVVHVKKNKLNLNQIKAELSDPEIKEDTMIGMVDDVFDNNQEIQEELQPVSTTEFFNQLNEKVDAIYA